MFLVIFLPGFRVVLLRGGPGLLGLLAWGRDRRVRPPPKAVWGLYRVVWSPPPEELRGSPGCFGERQGGFRDPGGGMESLGAVWGVPGREQGHPGAVWRPPRGSGSPRHSLGGPQGGLGVAGAA